jgi:hypothetical protein
MIRRATLTTLLLGVLSCGGDDPAEPETPVPTTMTLSATSAALSYLGETAFFVATVTDQFDRAIEVTVVWSSADASVAVAAASTTTAGQVTAVGNGTVEITATTGSLTASATVTVLQVASRISIVSGHQQSATVGEALAQPLVIRSEDQGGAPVAGVDVSFAPGDGDGSLTVSSATTDAQALASTVWTLGNTSGLQFVTASLTGAGATGAVTFNATADAGPPTAIAKTSGDQQTSSTGWPLDEPLVVTLEDEFGNGIEGLPVAFTPAAGSGSVPSSPVATGEDGTAQTTWTMGAEVGTNTLTVSAEGVAPVQFTATAELPRADLSLGEVSTSPNLPTSLQAFEVSAPITNVGHLSTGSGFQAQVMIDGVASGTVDMPALDIGATQVARFTVGPLSAGSHVLEVMADAAAAVDERNETNNSAETSRDIPVTALLTAGTPVVGIGAPEGQEFLYTLEVGADEPGTMIVEISEGTGDVDLYVHYGERPAHRDDYECQSGNPDTSERCVFNAAEPGTYHILLYAWADYSGATLVATTGGEIIPFNIELEFINRGTTSQDSAFVAAAERWMAILPGDISDYTGFTTSTGSLPANQCMEGQPEITDVIDDVRIFVNIIEIDSAGGTLARAGPCVLRGLGSLPIVGVMEFDEADLAFLEADGGLLSVVLHEMGHVLGIGTIWDRDGIDLLQNPSLPSSPGVDTHFSGARAIAAFEEAGGGSTYTLGEKVPVANLADAGSSDAHWREAVLGEELMTPGYNSGVFNPLSAISIASMKDIGYSIDLSQADAFSKVYRAPSPASSDRPVIDLSGDIRQGPIYTLDKGQGRLREVVRR